MTRNYVEVQGLGLGLGLESGLGLIKSIFKVKKNLRVQSCFSCFSLVSSEKVLVLQG